MHAIRVHEGNELRYEDVPDPQPDTGEAVVELRAAGVNRRDLFVRSGTYPFPLPLVPGSDGAGVRTDTGEEVVVFPALGWGDREDAPAPGFGILGGPRDGTHAELVALPVENRRRPSRNSGRSISSSTRSARHGSNHSTLFAAAAVSSSSAERVGQR